MNKKKHARISLDAVRLGEHLRRQAKKKDRSHNAETLEPEHIDKLPEDPSHDDEECDSCD